MKQFLPLIGALTLSLSVLAQNPTQLKEEFDGVTPCQLGWLTPGNLQYSPGHDFSAAAYNAATKQMDVTLKTHATSHGPMYYQLTPSFNNPSCTNIGAGQVDISLPANNAVVITAKATAPVAITVYIQEGSSASWDYSKFSETGMVLNLTTTLTSFYLTNFSKKSINPTSPDIDLSKIGIVAFELNKVGGVYPTFDGKVIIDGLYFGADATVGVSEVSNVNGVNIFPSPATDKVNINFEAKENTTVTITDITGRAISTQNVSVGTHNLSVNVSTYSEGLYFVTFSGVSGQHTEKLMVK